MFEAVSSNKIKNKGALQFKVQKVIVGTIFHQDISLFAHLTAASYKCVLAIIYQ